MEKVVLVTGSSRGIGKAIIEEFASLGYNVVINCVKEIEKAQKLENDLIRKYNISTMIVQTDVSKEEDVSKMVSDIMNRFGRIDVLVNNAGIAIDTTVEDKTVENFRKIVNVNLIGAFICSRECAKVMEKGSSIINIASTNAIDSYYPYSLDYDASKAGLVSLTKNLAVEYSPKIRVNAVAPGWVNTDMNKELDDSYKKEEIKKILLNRFAEPREIAGVVSFLASKKASYINGEVIKVDGGR